MEKEAYAVYRGQLEAGRVAYTYYLNEGVVRLETKALLDSLNQVIPAAVIGVLMKQEGGLVDEDAPPATPEEQAKLATLAFGDYTQLREALDAVAGDAYTEIITMAPEAATGDIEWWAVALSAGMVLGAIGKLPWAGAPVAKVLSLLLYGVVAYFGFTATTSEGKTIIKTIADGAVEAGGSLKSILLWGLGGLTLRGLIGAGIWIFGTAKDDRARRSRRELALSEA